MLAENDVFVEWEERVMSQEKGNRLVHFYLKVSSGDVVLAVVGTERSVRHMIYVVSDEFLQAYGSEGFINAYTKWRARREVVDWLTWLVSKHQSPSAISIPQRNELAQSSGSQSHLSNQMIQVTRKLGVQKSDIVWSGDAWICGKQLKHYPAFCRNGTTIAAYSFVFIMAEEENHHLGYLEDMYEDKKRQKRVKVRWFHHNKEVTGAIPQLAPHPKEVFITPYFQVISAECINGPATILTPKHYEECLAVVSHALSSGIYMCFRQIKNNDVKPFSLSKLHGYSNQAILSYLNRPLVSKHKTKKHISNEEEEEEFLQEDPARRGAKGIRSFRGIQRFEKGQSGVTNSIAGKQVAKSEPTYRKLKIKLSSKGPIGIKLVESDPRHQAQSLKADEKIEVLCQDSGIRGCWFRCKILQVSQKCLKVQHVDVEDVEGSGNLEEWVPAPRVAAPDKLGMRCSGRLTVRPWPAEDSSDFSYDIGALVDAWWSDGWWEGVVGVNVSGSDRLRIYLPGENRWLTVQRKDVRTSRDWVDNRWVDIKAKADVLSIIHSKVNPEMKLKACSTLAEASKLDFGSALADRKRLTTSRHEAFEEDAQDFPASMQTSGLDKVEDIKMKRLCIDNDDN